jgi:hypothetical protein
MKKKIDEAMAKYRLSEYFLRELGVTYYAKAVAQISAKAPGGVPTKEMNEALQALQAMFKIDKADTYASHMEYFGAVYRKSIIEAMGSTGVIRDDLKDSLSKLRDRLGVRERDTKELFLDAIEEKFVPMVEWINSEMERTMLNQKQLSERRGRDMGEDMFQSGKVADVSCCLCLCVVSKIFHAYANLAMTVFIIGRLGTWCRSQYHG